MTTRMRQVAGATALLGQPCTCIDGRTAGERHSVAGGSFALLIDAVHAAAAINGSRLTDDDATNWITVFARAVGPLYLHSDVAAQQRILAAMGLSPSARLSEFSDTQQRAYIELATRADMQGCSHLRLMLEHPQAYHVKARAVERLLRQFYRAWFNGQNGVLFEVLTGAHQESSIVISEADDGNDQVSLFSADEPAFYCSRPTKRQLLQRLAGAAADEGWIAPAQREQLARMAYDRHNASAEQTLATLAQHLPRFVVTH